MTSTNAPQPQAIPVTVDNFIRAETDRAMHGIVLQRGFGKFHLNRELMEVDKQVVPRGNRTLSIHLASSISMRDRSGSPFQIPAHGSCR